MSNDTSTLLQWVCIVASVMAVLGLSLQAQARIDNLECATIQLTIWELQSDTATAYAILPEIEADFQETCRGWLEAGR